MNEKPVCLYNEETGFDDFIPRVVVPKLMEVIAESGISFYAAKQVPEELGKAIESMCNISLESTRFKVQKLDPYLSTPWLFPRQ